MNRSGFDACCLKLCGQSVRTMLGTREHERLMPPTLALHTMIEQVYQQVTLVILRHAKGELFNAFGGSVAWRDIDFNRIAQHAPGKTADILRIRCRKQHALALLRQHLHDTFDVVDESHVEHAIALIENQVTYFAEAAIAALTQVQQSTGRRNQQITARLQFVDLRLLADASENHLHAQPFVCAVDASAFGDLRREFSRRREHEHPRIAASCRP